MRRLHLILYMTLMALAAQAQETVEEQLLVFRNTGEVNLLFTHEVDSIITDETTQTFYAKDTVLIVPLAELDSVAVGNRNVVKINNSVRQMTTGRDLPWLIRTEDGHLFYRADTPTDILPTVGEKLFYGDRHALLPVGLTAYVTSVSQQGTEIDVAVETVELHEIFDQLFYSGRVTTINNEGSQARRRAPGDNEQERVREPIPLDYELEVGGMGTLSTTGSTDVTCDFVIDVRNHFYRAHATIDTEVGFDYQIRSDDSAILHVTTPRVEIPLGTIAGVIQPSVYVNLFADLSAELRIDYSMKRKYHYEYEWTRMDGQQHGEMVQPKDDSPAVKNEANAQILLDGALHLGAELGFNLALTGNRVGFRFDAKAGPYLEEKIGAGVLRDMRDYQPELYYDANIDVGLKLALQASLFHHELFGLFGDEVETPLYSHDVMLSMRTWDLFPEYRRTTAVLTTTHTAAGEGSVQDHVDMATTVVELPVADIETGFEIVNAENEVVDSVYVGNIQAIQDDETSHEVFQGDLKINGVERSQLDSYTMRPVFHYQGFTISAAPVGIKKDVLLQPYISTATNGSMMFVSGLPFIGSVKASDGTLYQVGNSLPVSERKSQ